MPSQISGYTVHSGSDNSDASTYTTPGFTSAEDAALQLLWVGNSVASGTAGTPTVVLNYGGGGGATLTFTVVLTKLSNNNLARLTLFRAMDPSFDHDSVFASTLTIDFGGATQTSCEWSHVQPGDSQHQTGLSPAQFTDITGVNGANGIVQSTGNAPAAGATTGTCALAAIANTANQVFVCFRHAANEATTPKTGWTEIHDRAHALPNGALETQYQGFSIASDNAPSATWATTSTYVAIAVEVQPPVPLAVQGRMLAVF